MEEIEDNSSILALFDLLLDEKDEKKIMRMIKEEKSPEQILDSLLVKKND